MDTVSPPELVKDKVPFIVPPGSQIKIQFESVPLKVYAFQWKNENPQKDAITENNTILTPLEKGIYIYAISGEWKEGDVTYAFKIEVQ